MKWKNAKYLSSCLIFSQISCFSSRGNKLGTSPAFNKLFISSKKDSCLIYRIEKKAIIHYLLITQDFISCLKFISSNKQKVF